MKKYLIVEIEDKEGEHPLTAQDYRLLTLRFREVVQEQYDIFVLKVYEVRNLREADCRKTRKQERMDHP